MPAPQSTVRKAAPFRAKRFGLRFVPAPLCLVLLATLSLSASPDPAPTAANPVRRGTWAAFVTETPIISADGRTVRTAPAGEVVRVRILRGDSAEVGSAVPDLPGGRVPVASLRPADAAENDAWVAKGRGRIAEQTREAAALDPVPTADAEPALEAVEPPPAPFPPTPALPPAPEIREPVIGWFTPGRATDLHAMALGADGSLYLTGVLKSPVVSPAARGWLGAVPEPPIDEEDTTFAFIARITPDLASLADMVVFLPDEAAAIRTLRSDPLGRGIWASVTKAGGRLAGKDAHKAPRSLVLFSPDLRSAIRAVPVLSDVKDFAIDAAGRPIVLESPAGRKGGGFLARYFSSGLYERLWPDAPDGPVRRLKLDFSSPALADGPFALWARKSETLPDFPTPLGPWGSAPNAGQPVSWTNVKTGTNPIHGANLSPEALVLDRDGNLLVSGTIPFHMGFPDFDPFLLKFTPAGRLLWNNCFLNGLLSEPDQKTQALAIDPSNGDIVVSYWQHGNNRHTLLLAPDGWLTQFTGTSGNIKITWIGRVDPASGKLKNASYIYSRKPSPANPRWPDLNSVDTDSLAVNSLGWVFAAGAATLSLGTTHNAFLPALTDYGSHPFLCVLEPNLSAPRYSTYLSPGQGAVRHIALRSDRLAILAGSHSTQPPALPTSADRPFLSATPPADSPEAPFIAIFPIPAEPDSWSFPP